MLGPLFWGCVAGYLAVGMWLNLGVGYLFTDSMSREAAVSGVLLSRDPHLAAIGFIFTPLTAFAQLPLGALAHWFPGLLRWNLAAATMSAAFMAGTVVQLRAIAVDRGCGKWFTWSLVALLAANPMVVLYAANGMSEAPFLFSLCWAVRRMIRWVRTDDVHDLLLAGVALALTYLTRYDALAPLLVCAVLVAGVSLGRDGGWTAPHRSSRWWAATMDGVVLALPGLLAFVLWSATSWLITGQAFAQFTSQYGNSAIIAQSGTEAEGAMARAGFAAAELLVLSPAFPVVLVIAAVVSWRRRDPEALAPVLLLGSVLGVQALLYVQGATFPLLRFYIGVVPLTFCLLVLVHRPTGVVSSRRMGPAARPRPPQRSRRYTGPSLYSVAAVALVAAGIPVTVLGMGDARLGALEHSLASVVVPGRDVPEERTDLRTFAADRRIADHLDSLELPDGSVLLDTVLSYAVVASSDHPRQFVVTSDSDFVPVLNDPLGRGVQYVLAVPNEGRGTSDAVNRRYPTMYDDGAGGLAALVLEVPNDGGSGPSAWRLYRIVGAT
ncbi:ABC transporter [Rhodococcus aerolatus]